MADPKTTIRMLRRRRRGDTFRDMDGYVFTDMAHARLWLSQAFVADYDISTLEIVEVGESKGCPRCGGTGHTQSIRSVRKLSVSEFLQAAP